MIRVPVIVDSHLRLHADSLSREIVEQIFNELTVENKAKQIAKAAKRWGWQDLPDEFILAERRGDLLVLPRGYAFQLKLLLRENNKAVSWIDRRTGKRGSKLEWRKQFVPRQHQPLAMKRMRKHQQGIYEAPTGSGKSLTCIWLIKELSPAKSIILVDRVDLLNQWVRDINTWLDIDCGIIGSGKWKDNSRIVVATVQSIWSAMKRGVVPDDFFSRFSLVIADECHHTSADSIQNIVGSFSSRHRLGVSATPDRKDDKFEITQAVLGEIIHIDDEDELRAQGVLVKPHVQAVRTNFKFSFWPSHDSDEDDICLVPGCKLSGRRAHGHQDNYQKLKEALVSDAERNRLVVKTIWQQVASGNHHHLVITDEVRHLEAIYTSLLSNYSHSNGLPGVRILTGKVTGKRRAALIEEIKQSKASITLATVAKEGLDIPVVDRIYLPFPSKNEKKVQQQIGRGTRIADGKTDAIIFDFQDINVDILKKQFRNRANRCYRALGIEVKL